MKSHDGFIDVQSEQGVGTTFRVYLPVAGDDAERRASGEPGELREGDGQLVLVVDDEEFILDTAKETLEAVGYRTLTAAGAEAAIELMHEHGDEVDAVITDLRMPHVNGFDLIRVLRNDYPHLPIVAASGLADGRTDEAVEAGAQTFLAKPFTAEKLQAVLQDVLRTPDEATAREG